MSLASRLARLSDDATVYVPGLGEVTVGAIRDTTERNPGLADLEEEAAAYWVHRVTEHLCEGPCGAIQSGRRV